MIKISLKISIDTILEALVSQNSDTKPDNKAAKNTLGILRVTNSLF